MTIQIIQGLTAAQNFIQQLRSRTDATDLPASVTTRLRIVFGRDISPEEAVATIIADIRRTGDQAVRDYTRKIDGVEMQTFWADAERIEAAYQTMTPELRDALHISAERIRTFHQQEPRNSWINWATANENLGQILRPIQRAGIYAPGGTAAYPSSLLMSVIPAQVAGVDEIIVATPPGPHGRGTDSILAAAHIVGLKRVLLVGGAQAIAALAAGTASIPRVDKIFGAGNLFVTLAKKQVYGDVGIDGLYGPTETLIIADDTANPAIAAADMLAQAEHDPLATAILITPSLACAEAVRAELTKQIPQLPRATIVQAALAGQGAILVVHELAEAFELANRYAPEHLCLSIADPFAWLGHVRNAGGVFIGESSSEALGDYVIGPSHVMPTRGTARFASPLHVGDFLKVISIFAVSAATARQLAPTAVAIAQAEGFSAHAAAAAERGKP